MKKRTPFELAGEIMAEIHMAALHGPIDGFEFIDTNKIKEMQDAHFEALQHVAQLIGFVLERHIGDVIVADEDHEPRPFPRRFPTEED